MFEKMTLQQYNEVRKQRADARRRKRTCRCRNDSLFSCGNGNKHNFAQNGNWRIHRRIAKRRRKVYRQGEKRLQQLANDDATAFDRIIKCLRLPKDTDEDKKRRANSLQSAYHMAALVPLDVMTVCKETLCKAEKVLPYLNKYVASDCVIGIDLLKRVIVNSQENVYANTSLIKDETLKNSLEKQAQSVLQSVQ